MRGSPVLAVAFAATACFGPPNSNPGEGDTCASCRPLGDGGARARPDAGPFDGGPPDAGPEDAGLPDSGLSSVDDDAGAPDGGPLPVCPAGSLEFPGLILDLCESETSGTLVPLDGVEVSTLQPYSDTVSSDGGLYVACIPNGVPTTLVYNRPGYITTYNAEVFETAPFPPEVKLPTSLVCAPAIANYSRELPQFNPKLAAVYVAMESFSNGPPCVNLDAGLSGWTFTATLPDGGLGDGGPWPAAYVDPTGTLQLVASTFPNGEAMIFNIDPGVQYVTVQGLNAQVGNECANTSSALGFTGRTYVAAGAIDFYPWLIP